MRAFISTLVKVVLAAVLAVFGMFGVLFIGMRTHSPLVQDRVRRFNKVVGNPRMLKTAGREGAKNSVVQHIGRTSGAEYQTPVTAIPTAEGYLVSLPYGQRADWVKNVLAAGSATLVTDGATVAVERPEVVPIAEVMDELPPGEQRVLRLWKVEESLVLHPAASAASLN